MGLEEILGGGIDSTDLAGNRDQWEKAL